jgi:hypothetical protein
LIRLTVINTNPEEGTYSEITNNKNPHHAGLAWLFSSRLERGSREQEGGFAISVSFGRKSKAARLAAGSDTRRCYQGVYPRTGNIGFSEIAVFKQAPTE